MSDIPRDCAPCDGDAPALSESQVAAHLADVPRWNLADQRLHRRFKTKDFRAALAWVNRVGMLAEEQAHHPDFHITSWNHVELVLWTHTVDGLSINDFVLARKIDALAAKDGLGE